MKTTMFQRLLGVILALAIALLVPLAALAATPSASIDRLQLEYGKVQEALEANLGDEAKEDDLVVSLLAVLEQTREDALDALGSFVSAEGLQSDAKFGSPKSDIFFQDANRDIDRYGFFRRNWNTSEILCKGAFNLKEQRGRFTVDYFMDTYNNFADRVGRRYDEPNWDLNKKYDAIGMLDYAEGGGYLFIQYAVNTSDTADPMLDNFIVSRLMIGYGKVFMSQTQMTKAQIQKNRVKSPYTSWEAFQFAAGDIVEFDGTAINISAGGTTRSY